MKPQEDDRKARSLVRILHMIEALNIGGMERNLLTLARKQMREGGDVFLVCTWREGTYVRQFREVGLPVEVLNAPCYYRIRDLIKLLKCIAVHKPDVLHTHGEPSSVGGRFAGILYGRSMVLMHAQNRPKPPRLFRHKLQSFLLTQCTAGIIACSRDTAEYYARVDHIPRQKLAVVHNCVAPEFLFDYPRSSSLRRDLGADDEQTILIGTVARLTAVKGHRYLLEAVRPVLARNPKTRFVFVGDGPERSRLENYAHDLGVEDSVRFCGFRDDIHQILRALDVFVLPTAVVEGLPLSIAEAMAARLPVIATDVGGVREIVHDHETGLLVPPRSAEALADAICFMLENVSEAKRMAEAGYELCMTEYAPDRMVERIWAVYECALKARPISQALKGEAAWN